MRIFRARRPHDISAQNSTPHHNTRDDGTTDETAENRVDSNPSVDRGEVHSPGGFDGPTEQGTAQEVNKRTRRRSAEELMVPEADFRSYYGRQVIHTPVWKVPEVPGYLYLGGMSGAAAVMGALGDATGNAGLRRTGRLAASGGSILSVVALIADLGDPLRFLNMLRVVKWTSPLSVGSWILSPFSAFAAAAAVAELRAVFLPVLEKVAGPQVTAFAGAIAPMTGRIAGVGSGVLGPALSTYTAVLIADTAVPAWHTVYPELPFVFAASGIASAGGLGMISAPVDQAGPARRMAAVGAGLELGGTELMERRAGMVAEAFHTGRAGTLLRLARYATITGGAGALVAGRLGRGGRAVSIAAGVLLNSGAALTRFGVYEAGMISAKDPKYTVVPQRERLDARRRAEAEAAAAPSAE